MHYFADEMSEEHYPARSVGNEDISTSEKRMISRIDMARI